jgi:zinc transport system ATP-binding protein
MEEKQAQDIVVRLEDVSFSYNGIDALIDVDLKVYNKDFVWIVGPNGGGKTTLLKIILGLLKPKKGFVEIFGKPPKKALLKIGYMTQESELDMQFPLTVRDVVMMGRLKKGFTAGPYRSDDILLAEKALEEVGLEDLGDRAFSVLSGGQKRRLLIARALCGEPELLILDEPTANLDPVAEKELYELLNKLNERLTIITVSHDPTFVSDFVKRAICVNRHVHEHPTSEINGQFMGDLYTGTRRMVRHDQDVKEE